MFVSHPPPICCFYGSSEFIKITSVAVQNTYTLTHSQKQREKLGTSAKQTRHHVAASHKFFDGCCLNFETSKAFCRCGRVRNRVFGTFYWQCVQEGQTSSSQTFFTVIAEIMISHPFIVQARLSSPIHLFDSQMLKKKELRQFLGILKCLKTFSGFN